MNPTRSRRTLATCGLSSGRYARGTEGGLLTHEDWLNQMREVTRLINEDSEVAIVQLTKLLDETEAATKSVVSSWHTRQCQSLLADIEKDRGNLERAARIDEIAADAAAQAIRELKHASAYMYASAALFRFSLDQNQEAMVLAEKALSFADTFIDPNELFERLIREVRRIREAHSGEGA
jgi:hypothetical protein